MYKLHNRIRDKRCPNAAGSKLNGQSCQRQCNDLKQALQLSSGRFRVYISFSDATSLEPCNIFKKIPK